MGAADQGSPHRLPHRGSWRAGTFGETEQVRLEVIADRFLAAVSAIHRAVARHPVGFLAPPHGVGSGGCGRSLG